jgi:site-specific DNA recombinase
MWSPRNGRKNYLLRGLLRCSICGLSFCGSTCHTKGHHYYICSGRRQGPYLPLGKKCPSRPVPGNLEEVIWADIQGFLRNPGPALEEAAAGLEESENATDHGSLS